MSQSSVRDAVFGPLRFDEDSRSFEATMQLGAGRSVAVAIDSMGIAPGEALVKARQIYGTVVRREQQYRRSAASRLLDLYNTSWHDGAPITIDAFERRLSLSSISIAPLELGVTLYYADNGLFAGHFIEVFLDANCNFSDAQLAG